MTNKIMLAVIAMGCVSAVRGDSTNEVATLESEKSVFSFDAGADLRIRQEIMHNVPTLPGGGMLGKPGVIRNKTKNQMRFRPRVWGEFKAGDNWRLYTRLVDEFRAGLVQQTHATTWPGEVVLDNLFIEGKSLFDGIIDIRAGRQDLYRMYGLNHIFVDGTTGDGSRTTYADIVSMAVHVNEDSWIDIFGLYNRDREQLRFGTDRSYYGTQLTGFGGNDTEMDDWGFGTIWNSKIDKLNYQLFWIQKDTANFHRKGVKHPRRQVNLIGTKLVPHWTESFSTPVEAMAQVGRNGENEELLAWAGYAGFEWKDVSSKSWSPFISGGLLALSGDKDARDEDGGHHGWDPMWYRGVDDSEMMLYGTTYGVGWWSNMYNLKTTAGIDIGPRHRAQVMIGPMFAEEKDGLGGGDGLYKGLLTQLRYDFPLLLADKNKGERFEIFGHLLAEYFNPGDYFATDKPAYFVRWQIDFKF